MPLSALWLISDSFEYLLLVQVVAGSTWAFWELTTFLLLFEHIDESERTSVLTTFNLANAAATVVGSLVGGLILKGLGESHAGYMAIFALSAGLRAATVPLLFRIGRIPVRHYAVAVRPIGVRPNTGSIDVPIVSGLESELVPEVHDPPPR
jgi:MFS family permease